MNEIAGARNQHSIRDDLQAQFESFRKSDDARNALIENLVHQYQLLLARYEEKCDDLSNETTSRRRWQGQTMTITRELDFLKQQTEANIFALAIIDGDGAIFQDHLLRTGADGGSEAGHILYNEIKKHLQERHGNIGNWTIMVQVYANFEGLSRKLAQVGVVRSPTDLHAFARAFSCNQPMFSFIDVGSGKERADHKIKEMLRLFMFNTHCKHILFGGTHDNGYLPNLEPFKRDDSVTAKLTLLATTPPEPGFLNLGMDVTKFSSVFRTDQLPDNRMVIGGQPPGIPPAFPRQSVVSSQNVASASNGTSFATSSAQARATVQTPPEELTRAHTLPSHPTRDMSIDQNRSSSGSQPPPSAPDAAPVPKAASVSPGSGTGPTKSISYAEVSNKTTAVKEISIAPENPSKPARAIYLNAYDQRIDMTLPKPEAPAMASLLHRIKTKKVCNNFHLLSHCSNGINCNFSHEPRLPPKELVALRLKARDRACPQSTACRDVDCLSGHNCPRGDDCDYDYCYFGEDAHDVDRAVKMKYYSNGDIDIVR